MSPRSGLPIVTALPHFRCLFIVIIDRNNDDSAMRCEAEANFAIEQSFDYLGRLLKELMRYEGLYSLNSACWSYIDSF